MNSVRLVSHLGTSLSSRGIDIIHPFQLATYNNAIPVELESSKIPEVEDEATLAVLIGNSRELWLHFIDALVTGNATLDDSNPLESFIEGSIMESCQQTGEKHRIYWSHRGSPLPAMQRCAQSTGLAYMDQNCHLCLHPKFGPWFALRALVVFDKHEWSEPPTCLLANPLSQEQAYIVKETMGSAIQKTNAFAKQRNLSFSDSMIHLWESWVAVRNAANFHNEYRYSDSQLRYHYTRDQTILEELVKSRKYHRVN